MTETTRQRTAEDVVRAVFDEVFNAHDIERIDVYFDGGYAHDAPIPPGREAFKAFMSDVFAAFPDLRGTIDDLVAAEDRVACRSTWRATHRGAFMGVAATNREIEYGVIEIFRLDGGRIVEHHQQADNLTMLTQLGLLPEPSFGGTDG